MLWLRNLCACIKNKLQRNIWLAYGSFGLALILSVAVCASIDSNKMQQIMQTKYGSDGVALLNAWSRMLDKAYISDATEKLSLVNTFFNQHIRYTTDSFLWKKSDYWATPLETMGMRAGDCEDYTIAKYLSLLELGVPNKQLRLIYVKAQIGGSQSKVFQAHMVLGYYAEPNAIPLILDSLVNTIEPANLRPDLHPIFSFNSEGLWVGNQATLADPTARLSRWRDLLARAKTEGFSSGNF